ncbi:MAG: sigma-70 family RNA polymerase sigma factor [Gemmataceae bacterium]|nr:sigma-70 family RNA polymerase sigma factor [Gemmataceae bacterium]
MTRQDPDTEQLIERVGRGDEAARSRLLDRHRARLRQMVAVRIDRRLAARVDPSDVVQEVLLEADGRLSDYLQERPLPFYPWLRQFAVDRLADLHRQHIRTKQRSVTREEGPLQELPEESAWALAERLFAQGSSPSARLQREEVRQRVQEALARLPERDREVLELRHLERLTTGQIAEVLGVGEGAVYTRHLRALRRLRSLLGEDFAEEES